MKATNLLDEITQFFNAVNKGDLDTALDYETGVSYCATRTSSIKTMPLCEALSKPLTETNL